MITPREMLRDYMTVLNILMQNPDADFAAIVGSAVTLKACAEEDEDDGAPEEARKENNDAPTKSFTLADIEL